MRKVLMVLGVIFICLVVLGVIVFSGVRYYTGRLNNEAKSYVDEVVPIIISSWSSQELINRVSPEFLQATPPEKIELLFRALSKQMGPLREYKGATGKVKFKISPRGRVFIIADYLAKAVFENAPATIKIRVIWRNDTWQIVGFLVRLKV